jgi:hypothetical protein
MKKINFEVTSFGLHILAMALMLCDHLWVTVVPGNNWLTDIGRIAFPIFAFMTAEGFFHTKNLKKYVKRLLIFALISEIPFNLMMGSSIFYPIHQNVLWTFLIGIGLMQLNEKVKEKGIFIRIITGAGTSILGYILGILTFADYNGAGVLMVLVFYFFRVNKWWCYLGQLVCLWYINFEILGGFSYMVTIQGQTHFIARQGFALLALIPIWLYRGKQGYHSRAWQYGCYAFYPLHLLILGVLKFL